MNRLGLNSSLPDLSFFPAGSWAIQVPFTLRKPYLSKDEADFYILDNPIRKEWVFKVPYVAPSQWKGALQAAMVRELVQGFQDSGIDEGGFLEKRLQLYRLFGNEKDGTAEYLNRILAIRRVGPLQSEGDKTDVEKWEKAFRDALSAVAKEFENLLRERRYRIGDIEGFHGRLCFYPTFFDHIGLEVINPHDRKSGTGKQPIYFECVPSGTKGVFNLLYVPLDAVDTPKDERMEQAKEDLKVVAQGVRAMLTRYGFGSKTSSGYGAAEVDIAQLWIVPNGWLMSFREAWITSAESAYS
jgi:CRISPR-associated protein Cmr2